MKKVLAILVILALSIQFAVSENENGKDETNKTQNVSIKGKVIDKNSGETLVGAVVTLEGTDKKSYTDLDGNFNIKLQPGVYSIVVSYISYKKSLVENVKISVDENNYFEIELISNDQ